MDRPALPVLPSPADAPRAALYRNAHHRRGAAWRSRAAAALRSWPSIRWRCSSAARDPARAGGLCARIGADFGYDEINLNVGCPSDRVQDGRFGACLMAEPALVGDCVAAMKAAVYDPGHGQVPHRHRRAGPGSGAGAVCAGDRARRRRCADRACPQSLAQGPVAEGEPRRAAARLRTRVSAQSRASAPDRRAQRRRRQRRGRRARILPMWTA